MTNIMVDTSDLEGGLPIAPEDDPFKDELKASEPANSTEPKIKIVDVDDAPFGRNSEGIRLDKNGQPAPHGLKKDMTAAKKRGRQAGSSSPSLGRAKGKARTTVDYRQGIHGLMQLPTAMLTGVGIATNNDVLLADGVTLAMHTPAIAEALNDLAQENSQVAGVLEKAMAVGPYGALIAAILPMAAQIATNHSALPLSITTGLGAKDPDEIIAFAKADMEAMRQKADANGTSH